MSKASLFPIALFLLIETVLFKVEALQVSDTPAPIVQAQAPEMTTTPKIALERLFTATGIEASWFSPEFLSQVPITQIQQLLQSLQSSLGNYREIQTEGKDYQVIFDRGSVPAKIALNSQGQITGLFFATPRLTGVSLAEIAEQFQALPGQVSLLVQEGKTERLALNVDRPLAVGSAFKLAILSVLQQQIAAGQHQWQQVLTLKPSWKSLPTGFLQTWPTGSFLTVQTLAALMISQSDNTATDGLLELVGRDAIEKIAPRNRPFLTTREAFILKSLKNENLLQRYRRANPDQRRALLQAIDRYPLPTVEDLSTEKTTLDIEWWFTAQELCTLMRQVKDLPLMTINPGLAEAENWKRVAFKGGSDLGALNLTTWLEAKDGKTYCVVATWNYDAPLEQEQFFTLYKALLQSLQ